MRILLVSHDFLPKHPSGTEIHTWQLGVGLRERGHQVEVFTTEKDIGRPHLSVSRRTYDGLPVHELVNNLFYRGFEETWDWPPAVTAFGRVLDEVRPDVVHVMHLLYLSIGCVDEAARRGIPVVYTLHDFWLQCPRFGQRIHADGAVCHTIDFARCGTCLTSFKFAQTTLQRRMARAISTLRSATGVDLGGAARGAVERLAQRRSPRQAPTVPAVTTAPAAPDAPAAPAGEVDPERAAHFEGAAMSRDRAFRERLVPRVARFLAPSRFLRARFVEWGIPPERIEHEPYGLDLAPYAGFERVPADHVRVRFVGTLAPHKGPHLLLEAWRLLPEELRARGRLHVHGPKQHHAEYVAGLERLAAVVGAELPGRLEREALPGVLARTDLLVVPSVWYENSPLTIHEATATRTPVLVSDLGGMAELVEPGVNGWRFAPGDVQALAAALTRVLQDPAELSRLACERVQVRDVRVTAEHMETRYAALVREAKP